MFENVSSERAGRFKIVLPALSIMWGIIRIKKSFIFYSLNLFVFEFHYPIEFFLFLYKFIYDIYVYHNLFVKI